ncbi:MAG TPA: chemotaxis protein CheA, partial [bacterium]|nr:chemotaxis protein CheA [bacterium]
GVRSAQRVGVDPAPPAAGQDGVPAAPAVPAATDAAPALKEQDREIFMDFFAEADEHLANFERMLLRLEQDAGDSGAIGETFRAIHSLKGMAGFLNLHEVNRLTHALESLLDVARKGRRPDATVLAVLFRGLDMVRQLIAVTAAQVQGKPATMPAAWQALHDEVQRTQVAFETQAPVAEPAGGAAAAAGEPAPEPGPAVAGGAKFLDSIKVKIERIDQLVNMVGELVIINNQVRQRVLATINDQVLGKNIAQQNRVVSELQELALALRMLPMGMTFQKLVRLVRDVGRQTGKDIAVQVSGEGTELDRNVIEELQDPLVHIVRNAVDHGLEPPAERELAGKGAQGTLRLSASHQSGMVVIEIADDGRGLNRERILQKGIERGLVDDPENITDQQIYALIFQPGFSTADQVTNLSGRGVGMDVVRKNLDRLRGAIDIETVAGQGTTFRIKIPLTLAIIDGMLIRLGHERFILPLTAIIQSLRIKPDQLTEVSGQGDVVNVRGTLYPLVRLYEVLGMAPQHRSAEDGIMILVQAATRQFCLQVDELIGQQEVVIKSLGRALSRVPGVAGSAIMGDGRVGLILDPEQLADMDRDGGGADDSGR